MRIRLFEDIVAKDFLLGYAHIQLLTCAIDCQTVCDARRNTSLPILNIQDLSSPAHVPLSTVNPFPLNLQSSRFSDVFGECHASRAVLLCQRRPINEVWSMVRCSPNWIFNACVILLCNSSRAAGCIQLVSQFIWYLVKYAVSPEILVCNAFCTGLAFSGTVLESLSRGALHVIWWRRSEICVQERPMVASHKYGISHAGQGGQKCGMPLI